MAEWLGGRKQAKPLLLFSPSYMYDVFSFLFLSCLSPDGSFTSRTEGALDRDEKEKRARKMKERGQKRPQKSKRWK